MRGEHNWFDRVHIRGQGSSPHARGAHNLDIALPAQVGIIPACAGSTTRTTSRAWQGRDHPRMRGEHRVKKQGGKPEKGSSPHARGALQRENVVEKQLGIIPACAGSTMTLGTPMVGVGDHPRMRGEHTACTAPSLTRGGSSPHARGALCPLCGWGTLPGIIPACAGSTSCRATTTSRRRDHPRMRGEHPLMRLPVAIAIGSSPHARGARHRAVGAVGGLGIIPACAGSTRTLRAHGVRSRDHPRMRGEHAMPRSLASIFRGSSPHARGARYQWDTGLTVTGIIPACAGSTHGEMRTDTVEGDHPRMRGEHKRFKILRDCITGSSPHARGALVAEQRPQKNIGIIPACAGSTW